ncbi:MAG TPA: AMP-binding protein [Candidatus Dormibacteraeota bacterium]|nr:AMP-binding protein [Candidatus Dormibacteraeota bacterium]
MAKTSYVSGTSDRPLIGETIGRFFDQMAMAHTDREALISRHQGLRYTYGELKQQTDRLAKACIAAGIGKGERVGIWSPNNAQWVVAQFGTPKAGVILVNINPAYRTSELQYALRQSGCSYLILAERFKSSDYLAMLAEVRETLPDLRGVIVLGGSKVPGGTTWEEFLALGDAVSDEALAARQDDCDFDEAINIQYTSGTTGFPKGATLSHHNILNNGYFIGETLRYTPEDRVCIPVPFYHCFGMVLANLACITHGSAMVLPNDSFDPLSCLEAVQAEKCTSLYGVPTMFIAELEHPRFKEFDLRSLRTGIMAGSPCPIEVMKRVISDMHMDEVTICYGMTETSPVSLQSHVDDPLEKRVSTVGLIHPFTEVKIVDPVTNMTVPRGTAGELCTRGYLVMLGYWDNPEATAQAIDGARWMHTGDLATMDDEDYVNIVGRIKDMIIRGGENVYPREIEEFLYTHPKVADVQVIGVPDVKYGEEICAWVKLREGESATEEEVREFCRGKIAHFKIPRYVKFTDAFPMTITGKIQKFKMREASTQELGLEAAASIKTA